MLSDEEVRQLEEKYPIGSTVKITTSIKNDFMTGEMWVDPMYAFLGQEAIVVNHYRTTNGNSNVFQLSIQRNVVDGDGDLVDDDEYIFLLNWIDDPSIKEFQKREAEILNKHFEMRQRLARIFKIGSTTTIKQLYCEQWPYNDDDAEVLDQEFDIIDYDWPEDIYSTRDFGVVLANLDGFIQTVHLDCLHDARVQEFFNEGNASKPTTATDGFAGLALAGLAAGIVGVLAASKSKGKEPEAKQIVVLEEVEKVFAK